MNCGKRWKATRRWRQEGPYERHRRRKFEAFGRDDLPAVPRAATGPRARTGSVRAHAGVRGLPHAAARAGARIAAADTRDARIRRTAAFAAGAISGTCAAVDAMDLGPGIWVGSHRRLRPVCGIHRALADTIGAGGIRRNEPAEPADFPELILERMAIDDHTSGNTSHGDAGRTGIDVPAAANPPGLGPGAGVCGIVHGHGDACSGVRDGISQG